MPCFIKIDIVLISFIFIDIIFINTIIISTLIFITCSILVKIMHLSFTQKKKNSVKISKNNVKIFYLLIACIMSISLIQASHAQSDSDQITFSDDLLNDPVAQDILKKIEQTKKMIAELEQKEYEKNQAQENLQKIRDLSVQRLYQDLDEWERLWEKYSSRNAFDEFVSKKPSHVQGVFWDQFEFKEQKVNAGRIAMNQVLANGGTMQDAKNAYNKAASTQRIELIEMNAQFNVKHNLADYEEQQIFNSTGQVNMTPSIEAKLANFYSDYRLQPSYMLANPDDTNISENTECNEGSILVSRVTSGSHSCVDESTVRKWIENGIKDIVVSGNNLPISEVKTNPGTVCNVGYRVVYHIVASEYRCVLESDAKEMIQNNIAENHTLIDYIASKDKLKVHEDIIYGINQGVIEINQEFDLKKKALETKYDEILESENLQGKQKIQNIVHEYMNENITKEDVTKQISEIRNTVDILQEQILGEKVDAINILEAEHRDRILDIVKEYKNDPDINVDWNYLNGITTVIQVVNEKSTTSLVMVSLSNDVKDIRLDNVGVVNSFGQKFDEIKAEQVLHIAADITNLNEHKHDFAYLMEITDSENKHTQPPRWITGTLNPTQTFNVSLSWMPEEPG
ncbi:MAG: hypothetical protein DA329_11425, partial [Candidatus Nitrosocosmicus sp.]|nr:hypothetical protein [Candidatus Nitrosocosmicus sp.]